MSEHEIYDEEKTAAIDIQSIFGVILKRKWIVISFTLVLVAIVTIASFLQEPSFMSTGTLLIEEEPNILNFEQIYMDTIKGDFYQTQYKMLASRTVADITLERLKLYENQEYIGNLKGKNDSSGKLDAILKKQLIDSFLRQLSVSPITNRLVAVSFRDSDPQLATDIVNTLLEAYIDMKIQKKYFTTEKATDFLSKQIAEINAEIEMKEKKLQEYGAEKNIIILNDKETTIVENLKAINRALAEAQIERVKKESDYNEIKSANPNDIPDSLSNEIILNLRKEYAKLNREYIEKSQIYEAGFPEMQSRKAELDSINQSLIDETQNLIKSVYADYQAAVNKESSLRTALNRQKLEANKMNSNAILYNSLQTDVENKKAVLGALLTRQGEAAMSLRLKGMGSTNVSILDRATVPIDPSSPKKKRNVILAFMIGLIGGLGLAFVFEALDKSVKNLSDVEKYSRLPALGIVPAFSVNGYRRLFRKRKRKTGKEVEQPEISKLSEENEEIQKIESIALITHVLPKSKIAENYRSIRTSLLLSSTDSKPQTLAISSPLPQEGKSITISNLAVTFAHAGKKVLIIDSDLRKPSQHEFFKIKNQNGLTDFLSGNFDGKELVKKTQISNLFFVNSGSIPANPLELLGSKKMADLIESLKKHFDYIFFDTPPLLLLSDAIVLGHKSDGVILVVWGGKTSWEALRQSREKLDSHKIKCLGVIINSVDLREHDYHYMKHYHHYYEY